MYKALTPQFMTSHQIIYEITCTVFMISPALSPKSNPPYLFHHNDSIDGLRPTLCVTSHPLYGCQLMHSTQRRDHTHVNTNIISAILPAISNTTSTVSVSSNPGYQLYHTHSLYDITHYRCDIIFSMHAITNV